jgi:hypothetical protein
LFQTPFISRSGLIIHGKADWREDRASSVYLNLKEAPELQIAPVPQEFERIAPRWREAHPAVG